MADFCNAELRATFFDRCAGVNRKRVGTHKTTAMANEIPLTAAAMVDNNDGGNNGSSLLPDQLTAIINGTDNNVGNTKKKTRHRFRKLAMQSIGRTIHPFLDGDEPDYKELVLYRCLARSRPFTTAKGHGLTEAWNVAVQEINEQKNCHTGKAVFDPPIPVKTVRDRFEGVMQIIKELQAAEIPYRCHDKPNEMMYILAHLYELKTRYESRETERKNNAADVAHNNTKVSPRGPMDSREFCVTARRQASFVSPAADSTVMTDNGSSECWDDDDDDDTIDTEDSGGDVVVNNNKKKKKSETPVVVPTEKDSSIITAKMANVSGPLAAVAAIIMVDKNNDGGNNNGSGLLPNHDIIVDKTKKPRHTFRRLTKQRMGKTIHPFIDEPDGKELALYHCLAQSRPFTTVKGQGLTAAWTAAVEDINQKKNCHTGKAVFDPPIPVKTVRERFEGAMKIVKELQNAAEVTYDTSEEDDKNNTPNAMMQILEHLYELKTSFETGQMVRKRKNAAAAQKDSKVSPRTPIGEVCAARHASLSPPSDSTVMTDGSSEWDDDDVDTDIGSFNKRSEPSPGEAAVAVLAQALAEMRDEKKADRALKRQRLEVQLEKDRQQIALNAAMLDMMKTISASMKKKN
jgi:hypothetical protein